MDAQAIYDKVKAHLLAQGKKAFDMKQGCLYRAPDGCKCAAGVLIPDDEYLPEMENKTFRAIFLRLSDATQDELRLYVDLISELQSVHDNTKVKDWSDKLSAIARVHGLNP